MAASTQRVADGGRNMAMVLDEVGAATCRTSDELAGLSCRCRGTGRDLGARPHCRGCRLDGRRALGGPRGTHGANSGDAFGRVGVGPGKVPPNSGHADWNAHQEHSREGRAGSDPRRIDAGCLARWHAPAPRRPRDPGRSGSAPSRSVAQVQQPHEAGPRSPTSLDEHRVKAHLELGLLADLARGAAPDL